MTWARRGPFSARRDTHIQGRLSHATLAHRAVRARVCAVRASACRFEPVFSEALPESQDAEARAEAVLGVRTFGEDRVARRGAGLRRPGEDPRRRPLRVGTMRARHVLAYCRVAP